MKRYVLVVVLAFLITGCGGDSGPPSTYEENDSSVLAITTQTELIIINTNGSIVITGSDMTNELRCSITKKVTSQIDSSDAQSHISDIDITVDENANNITYEVDHPSSESRSYEVNFTITVPNNLNFVITMTNGDITLQSVTTAVEANLLNGDFDANLTLNDANAVSVTVGNGTVSLTLPNATNADLSASVVNGTIINAGLTFTNEQISSTLFTGTLGTGNGSIILDVGNGHVEMYQE